MTPKKAVERFWDRTLEEDVIDHDELLEDGGEELVEAVELHKLLERAGEKWRNPDAPRALDRFKILESLGSGGLGQVWLAWDPELRRHVAIKVIERDRWAVNEARSIAQLEHIGVVKVFEIGRDRIVMELLDGGSLLEEVEALKSEGGGRFPELRDRLVCLLRIAEGLAYCHERGVLHRDVKPGNVMFPKDDPHPRLIDFGLAHTTDAESLDITQNLVGTPAYVAPEQVESGETGVDPRSDQFSFGVLAYEFLSLECPFKRSTRSQTFNALTAGVATPLEQLVPELTEPFVRIVRHCMELDPQDRYDSMDEVVLDLREALAERPISVGRRGSAHLLKLWYRRNRRMTQAVGLAFLAAIIIAAGVWVQGARADRASWRSDLARESELIPELESTKQLSACSLRLLDLRGRSRYLDDEVLASGLLGRTEQELDRTLESWSRHFGATARAAFEAHGRAFDSGAWGGLFVHDEELAPHSEWNADLRDRGKLKLSEGLAARDDLILYRSKAKGPMEQTQWSVLEQIPMPEYLSLGHYRLEIPGEWQRDFVVSSQWPEPVSVERRERLIPDDQLLRHEDLPGRLFSEIITNAEFAEFCAVFGYEISDTSETRIPDGPAGTTWTRAHEYAIWAGGRLPDDEEMITIHSDWVRMIIDDCYGEWLATVYDTITLNDCCALVYEQMSNSRELPPIAQVLGTGRNSSKSRSHGSTSSVVGFRVVYVE